MDKLSCRKTLRSIIIKSVQSKLGDHSQSNSLPFVVTQWLERPTGNPKYLVRSPAGLHCVFRLIQLSALLPFSEKKEENIVAYPVCSNRGDLFIYQLEPQYSAIRDYLGNVADCNEIRKNCGNVISP